MTVSGSFQSDGLPRTVRGGGEIRVNLYRLFRAGVFLEGSCEENVQTPSKLESPSSVIRRLAIVVMDQLTISWKATVRL